MSQNTSLKRLAAVGAVLALGTVASGQINYAGGTYAENFNTLPTTNQTGIFSSTIGTVAAVPGLAGWSAAKVAGSGTALLPLNANNGSANGGALYSYGVDGDTERALGALGSGTVAYGFGTEIVNQTGGTVTSVTISFTAEFWRSSTGAQNLLTFAYGLGGVGGVNATNFITSTAMVTEPLLDVVGPLPVATNTALNGNDPLNQTAVSFTINGLSWAPGGSLFLRWVDVDNTGADAGLAIDNFSLSGVVSTGVDVSRGAGTNFTPTSFGGNPFTASDTAVFDGSPVNVTVSGAVEAFALKFTASGYTVTGAAGNTLAVESTTFVDTDVSATISAILAGDSGLIKTGDGMLTLTGANTFEGLFRISAGRVVVGADSAFGAADNDVTVNGTLQLTTSSFTLGTGRTLAGSGVIETPASGNLTVAGSMNAGALTFSGPSSLTFAGTTNSLATFTLPQTTTVQITGGALQPSAGLAINQFGGTTTINGNIAFGASGDRAIAVAAGTLELDGAVSLGGRMIKTGAGTLDLTGASVSGTTGTNGGIRFGVQGGTASEGGTLILDEASSLGNLQFQFNSGTLEVNQPIVTNVGVSFGSRREGIISPAVMNGQPITFNGPSSFFSANGAVGKLGFNINNTTTINGTIPVIAAAGPISGFVEFGGTGTFVLGSTAVATALTDNFAVTDSLTFVMNGSFGGRLIEIDPEAVLSGGGTFTGTPIADSAGDNRVRVIGTLAPTGALTFNSSLVLESASSTILTIDGVNRGSQYSAVSLTNTAESPSFTYVLNYGGSLSLVFGAPAKNGNYDLFSIGAGVTRSGGFASVTLAGSHTGNLVQTGSVWSGTSGGTSFSFDESTGVLTVTGGVAATTPLEDWRQTNFNTTLNEGTAADAADFDGDGIANLIEYATGTDPKVANASPVVIGRNGTGEFLTLSFNRIADPALTYSVVAGNDLTAGLTTVAQTYSGSAADTVTYTDTVSLNTPGVRRFLALRVSYSVDN